MSEDRKTKIYYFKKLALHNIEEKPSDGQSLLKFLKRWWCNYYNKPYKDPLLEEYTLEELLLEYYEILFTKDEEAKKEAILEIDKIDNEEDDEEWLKEQMGDDYMTAEEMVGRLKEGE